MTEKEKIEQELKLHEEFRFSNRECDLCDRDACKEQDENSSEWRWCTLYNEWLIINIYKEREAKKELLEALKKSNQYLIENQRIGGITMDRFNQIQIDNNILLIDKYTED